LGTGWEKGLSLYFLSLPLATWSQPTPLPPTFLPTPSLQGKSKKKKDAIPNYFLSLLHQSKQADELHINTQFCVSPTLQSCSESVFADVCRATQEQADIKAYQLDPEALYFNRSLHFQR